METYYTKKEYNEMRNSLNRKIKTLEKKVISLQTKYEKLKTVCKETSED